MKSPLQIYLAPFQGITGPVYREVYTRHFPGVDKLFTPFFTNIYKQKSLPSRIKELSFAKQNNIPVVPQVLSKDADEIIRFGQVCSDNGFDEINWNLGCPFPRVAAKKRGSGMLPYPEMVNEILEKSIPKLSIKISIKCRLGYKSPDEILKLIPVLNDYTLSELIIHARIGKQVYKGHVNLDSFREANSISSNSVVYNGDIFSAKDYKKVNEQLEEMNSWMIGRGLLVDPFLPSDIKKINHTAGTDRAVFIRKFTDDLYLAYRKDMNDRLHAINVMKELWEYMSWSFNDPHKVFNLVKKTKTFDDYEEAVKRVFDEYTWMGSVAGQFNSDSL